MQLNLCTEHASQIPLGGRLVHFYQKWKTITSDPWVLETIIGYKIELLEILHQTYIPTMHVTTDQREALHEKHAIHHVLEPNCHKQTQFISPLFTVPRKGGGQRPVINLKDLNHFVEYQHFKMEGVTMLKDLLKPNDFMTKIDLKDAYLTVPVWQNHTKYLRFLWKDTKWEFTCLPFGLTKLLKPVVAQLRKMGIIIYLDDILIMAESREISLEHTTTIINLLTSLGFIINKDKSVTNPTLELKFLGFLVNSTTMSLYLPKDKVKGIRKDCQRTLTNPIVSIRKLSRLVGKLSASTQAVFPAPLHYQFLMSAKNIALRETQSYEGILTLDQTAQ